MSVNEILSAVASSTAFSPSNLFSLLNATLAGFFAMQVI
jgi:hypothetical protein